MNSILQSTLTPVLFAALTTGALSGCNEARTQASAVTNEQRRHAAPAMTKTTYPRALWGIWRLGPEPCRLPINPDGDGRLHITGPRMVGYETYSEPISIIAGLSDTNTWRIRSKENYLGSQVTEEVQVFELDKNGLTVRGDSYEEKYVKCEIDGAEQSVRSERRPVPVTQLRDGKSSVEFPEAMRGDWMIGPEPCYLPINPDADGQLTITADRMYGYEDTYELVSITADPAHRNMWAVVTVELLGEMQFEMKHELILDGSKLIAKHGKEYRATYVRCEEKNND